MLVLMSLTSPVLSSVAALLTIFIVAIVDRVFFLYRFRLLALLADFSLLLHSCCFRMLRGKSFLKKMIVTLRMSTELNLKKSNILVTCILLFMYYWLDLMIFFFFYEFYFICVDLFTSNSNWQI